jgi:hypothetical protein
VNTLADLDDILRLVAILGEHEVLTKDSAPGQLERHPYTGLITDLMVWKHRGTRPDRLRAT